MEGELWSNSSTDKYFSDGFLNEGKRKAPANPDYFISDGERDFILETRGVSG